MRTSASCGGVGSPSQDRGAVSALGRVTSLRPLRRLIWIGTEMVNRPSLARVDVARPIGVRDKRDEIVTRSSPMQYNLVTLSHVRGGSACVTC
jgi:hypothetical protein